MALGKITVTHYLNTKLKKKAGKHPFKKGEYPYPVYVRIRFNNKQTEFKSMYPAFFDGRDRSSEYGPLIDEIGANDSLTEAEFRNLKPGSKAYKAIKREEQSIREIITLFAEQGINIIEKNPTHIIEKSLLGLLSSVSLFLKKKMRDVRIFNYEAIDHLVDWSQPWVFIYDGIDFILSDSRGTGKFKKHFYEVFADDYKLVKLLFEYPQWESFSCYQWKQDGRHKADLTAFLNENVDAQTFKRYCTTLDQAVSLQMSKTNLFGPQN